jgi:hypothetical protein
MIRLRDARPTVLLPLVGLMASVLVACTGRLESSGKGKGDGDGSIPGEEAIPTATDACTSPAESFERELYVPVFSRCIGCHNEHGMARQEGSELQLRFPEDAGAGEANATVLLEFARKNVNTRAGETAVLLAKPTGKVGHMGGQVLAPESNQAQLLQSFIAKLLDPPTCTSPADSAEEALATLSLSSYRETYARAVRLLTGQPVDEKKFAALANTEEGLLSGLAEVFETEAFRKRLGAFYGDALLPMANGPINVDNDILDRGGWPSIHYFNPPCADGKLTNVCCSTTREACCFDDGDPEFCAGGTQHIQVSIAYEPLAFIEEVTKRDLPITEILTRQEAIVNPYTAALLGMDAALRAEIFDDDPSNDADEWRFAPVPATELNALQPAFGESHYPHAGILSTPSLLARYYSTKSNLHRTRAARLIFEHMLDIDVKTFADFSTNVLPADANLERATVDYPACLACHAAIDPVARHFEYHWGYGFFRPDFVNRTPEHFPAAGFLGESPPAGASPVAWLGARVAQHERFRLAMLKPVLVGLLGIEFLAPPQRFEDTEYATRWLAFRIQQVALREILDALPSGAITFKDLVSAAVKSRFFRASGSSGTGEQRAALRHAGVGGGVLLTPELLEGQLGALLHGQVPTGPTAILSKQGFRYLLGGTNWRTIEERSRVVSPVAVRTLERVANEVACRGTSEDFSIVDKQKRILFKNVEWDWTAADHEDDFRKEIVRLILLFHAREVGPDDPRVDEVLKLWKAAHQKGSELIESGAYNSAKVRCAVTTDEVGRRSVSADPDYVIRAWATTVSFLITDPDFVLE